MLEMQESTDIWHLILGILNLWYIKLDIWYLINRSKVISMNQKSSKDMNWPKLDKQIKISRIRSTDQKLQQQIKNPHSQIKRKINRYNVRCSLDYAVKIVFKYQPSGEGGTRSPPARPAKSKMAARGPQNGERGLERCLLLGFWAF